MYITIFQVLTHWIMALPVPGGLKVAHIAQLFCSSNTKKNKNIYLIIYTYLVYLVFDLYA